MVDRKLWSLGGIQLEPEHASRPDGTRHADGPSHQFHQTLAHHQADARAFLPAALSSETVEGLKELHQHFRRQPRAGIPDAHSKARRGARGVIHHHRSIGLVVFDRVGKKIDENLFQPGPVGIHKVRGAALRKGHADASQLRLRLNHSLAFQHHLGQRSGLPG